MLVGVLLNFFKYLFEFISTPLEIKCIVESEVFICIFDGGMQFNGSF